MKKALRDYQIRAKEAVFNALKRGRRKQLVVKPGGTGKTALCASVMHEFDGRKGWISHEESLAEQSAIHVLGELDLMPIEEIEQTINSYNGLISLLKLKKDKLCEKGHIIYDNIGMVKADVFDIDKPIVICSAQSLWKHLDKIPKDWFSVIIVDEGDLFGSVTFNAPLLYFTPQLILGVTATPMRTDGMLMEDLFEEIVFEYPIQDAIKDGWLTELNAIVVKTSTSLDDVHITKGDFNQKELTEVVNTPQRNNLIVNKYIEYCNGQQFICFGADVQHVIDLHEAFREKGISTAYVVSDKERMEIGTERKQITRDYRAGKIMGLINFNIYGAGFDHKDCGCVILACPTKSKRKFLQQLFRVTRLKTPEFVAKFGQIGTILDVVDGTNKHSVINTKELDRGLEIEDRVFTSRANKDKLLAARREREFKTTYRKEDKKVDLFKVPKVKISTSFKMSEPATEAQLAVLEKWGYDTKNEVYTKKMVSEIFGQQEVSEPQRNFFKAKGYAVEGNKISIAQAQIMKAEIEAREKKKQLKKW